MIPKDVIKILETLEKAGHTAYIVGGSVRDMIMKKTPNDWDITTSAKPEQVKRLFKHTYDTGIEHGTVTILLHQGHYEVTTYRMESDYSDCRHPDKVEFVDNIELDLSRRDFTINAIAYHPKRGFVDPYEGQKDIARKTIRSVRCATERFSEDALRILRAIRFSAQLGFKIEQQTLDGIEACKQLLKHISKERIRDELNKILVSPSPDSIGLLNTMDLMPYLINEPIGEIHLDTLCQAPSNLVVRLALFLQNSSAKTILRQLKYDNQTIKSVTTLIRYQNYFEKQGISKVTIKQFLKLTDVRLFEDYLLFLQALGKKVDLLQTLQDEIMNHNEPYLISHLAITGNDLMNRGVSHGKEIGNLLNKALEYVIENPALNNKTKLFEVLKL